jgi:RNA polymerase sigma-70 factor (ECF subfamily)
MSGSAWPTVIYSDGQKYKERDGASIGVTEHSGARIKFLQEQRKGLERFLRARVGSSEEAKELAQEACTRLLEQPSEKELSDLKGWLWVTARNLANTRDEQRKNHRAAIPLLQAAVQNHATPESWWSDQQEAAAIRRAIAGLPERQRQVIDLRREGRNYQQIAQALGVTERTCRRDLAQAMIEIRTKIGME